MRTAKDKIKFAVIGCGHIGKKHASVILSINDCELVALCDVRDKDELNINFNRDIPLFKDIDSLLKMDFDILCIATPNGLHEEHALRALEHKKHLIIEKPMSLSRIGCERIISKAIEVNRYVFCAMQNRYSLPSQWLKSIINQKLLGELYIVQVNCYWNRNESYYNGRDWHGTKDLDGGTLFTQFSHYIDIIYWLFGDIKNINGRFANFNHAKLIDFEDSGLVSFEFEKGGLGALNYSTSSWSENMETSIIVLAEKGSVKISGQSLDSIEYCNIKNYNTQKSINFIYKDKSIKKRQDSNRYYLFQNIIKILNDNDNDKIVASAIDGLKVVDIIERMYNSANGFIINDHQIN